MSEWALHVYCLVGVTEVTLQLAGVYNNGGGMWMICILSAARLWGVTGKSGLGNLVMAGVH
jgi:hypothetical protein